MIRILLFLILIIMILRILIIAGRNPNEKKPFSWKGFRDYKKVKGVPKGVGEIIDFEEIRKKE